ncbi:MAG: quinone oxidoreductase [Gammaproteobacteria bacterium]|nr:quinone oxidoreductase [Gammaproteobacteria bacterium]
MTKAIRVYEVGGPDVMQLEELEPGQPGEGEVTIRNHAIGLNYIDVYFRTGSYPPPSLPFTPGLEGAAVVTAVGPGVSDFKLGDRVAYAAVPMGAYCQERVMPAHRLLNVPDGIDDNTAAAMMLKGMTAEYLLRRTYPVKRGDTILFHAAAGGVGLIACQWAHHLGVTVIGTVGSETKAELAARHGCDFPILYKDEDFVERVRQITDGKGVDVVYDSVGKHTFLKSIDCLRPLGMMVSFGQSSGVVPPLDIGLLSAKGSLFLTRPTLMTYTQKREDLVASARELFDVVLAGAVSIEVEQTYPLERVADAHRDLESRRTVGSTVLLP